jgi:hypothetical protein
MISILVAMSIMAAFNSRELLIRARGLPPGYISEQLVFVAAKWHETMQVIHADKPVIIVRDMLENIRNKKWSDIEY